MDTAFSQSGGRQAVLCLARMTPAARSGRPEALLNVTRRLAQMQQVTCIILDIQDTLVTVLAGQEAALDSLMQVMEASLWHDGPHVVGLRQPAPPMGLTRSAVRPVLLESEKRWLEHEVACADPRHATVFALLDWAILRNLEEGLLGACGRKAPFPTLPPERQDHRS